MHQDKTVTIAPGVSPLAAAFVLIASCLAAAPAVAQTGNWKSYLSPDAPEVIYRQHCAACHGVNGDGKSLAEFALDPPPRDFTSPKAQKELSRAHMIEVLNKGALSKEGKPTAMIAWKNHLSREQIAAVVDYVIVRFMDGKVASNESMHAEGLEHKGHDHSAAHIKPVDYPFGLKPNVTRGQTLYTANCQSCHGEYGDGDGQAARGAAKPRSFHEPDFHQFANGFTVYSAVARGRGHSASLEKTLSKQDIADVSEYLLQSYVKPHMAAHSHGK